MQADEGREVGFRDAQLPAEAVRDDVAGGDPAPQGLGRDLQAFGDLVEGMQRRGINVHWGLLHRSGCC